MRHQIPHLDRPALVFDEKARESFLTGFKKRKDERRKKAREQLEQKFKEEKKRIRMKERDKMLERIRSQLPDSVNQPEEVMESETIDLPNHTVTVSITEVAEVDLGEDDGTRLGTNKMESSDDEDPKSDGDPKGRNKSRVKNPQDVQKKHTSDHNKKKGRKKLQNPLDPKKGTKPKVKGNRHGLGHVKKNFKGRLQHRKR